MLVVDRYWRAIRSRVSSSKSRKVVLSSARCRVRVRRLMCSRLATRSALTVPSGMVSRMCLRTRSLRLFVRDSSFSSWSACVRRTW